MRRIRAIALLAAVAALATPASADPLPAALQILGRVTNAARPVANALIIALNLADFDAKQTFSGADGTFALPPLRSGIYRIIAVKQGFAPSTTTVLPTKADHNLAIRLQSERQGRRTTNQEIWEIRGSLPPDILRELDQILEPQAAAAAAKYETPRFRGEMMSTTGVATAADAPASAQTTLGVQSRIGQSWQLGFRGNIARIDDPTDGARFGPPIAAAQVMSMELRSSPTDAYRVASTRSSWRYADDEAGQADVRAHNFEWEHGPARVAVRYLAQENLFTATPFASDVIEIAGESTVVQTPRSGVGLSLRVTQETLHDASGTLRTADLAANGTLELVPAFILHYGMASRFGVDQHEWAPRTGAEWKIGKNTSLVGSAMYKVVDRTTSTLPAVIWADEWRVLPQSVYTVGIVSGPDERNRLSAMATVTQLDGPARVLFGDGFEQFWDGLSLDTGDVRRDLRVAWRRDIGKRFAVDVSTSAGSAGAHEHGARKKAYVAGDLQSTFTPTGTTLAVSYREIQQPRESGVSEYHSERVNVRMAQSLYLPIDVKLLLGIELARATNSPFLVDALDADGRKYVGGLAVNF